MAFEILAIARDASIILLAIEYMLIAAVPLVALYFVTRGLRQLIPQVRLFMRSVRAAAQTGFDYIERAMAATRDALIWVHMRVAAVQAFTERLRRPKTTREVHIVR